MHRDGLELRSKCIISGVDTSTVHQSSQSHNKTLVHTQTFWVCHFHLIHLLLM
jgi:hypothetical protein